MAHKSNYSNYVKVRGTSYSDSVYNYGEYVKILAKGGKDYIYNSGKRATVSGGAGNDTIENSSYGDYVSLSGGSGRDSINAGSYSYNVTLNGGTGNDTLIGSSSSSYGDVFRFGNYDGYDVITNYGENDTIYLSGVYYSSNIGSHYASGSDYVIYTSGGKITLKNAANSAVTVKLAGGSTYVLNDDDDADADSDADSDTDDYILNYDDYETVYGTSDTDTIGNAGKYVTISAGSGNDYIYNHYTGDYSSISAGSGNDYIAIHETGWSNTINGGSGNDTLTGSSSSSYGDVFQFGNYDGYDVITNYGTNDTIHLTGVYYSSNIGSHYASGSDYVIYTSGGKITLKNAASKAIKIKLSSGSMTTLNTSSSYNTAELFAEDNFVSLDKVNSKLDSIVEIKNIGDFETAQTDKITDKENLITYAER